MKTLTIVIHDQVHNLLEQLVPYGIYGSSVEEIAARFVDDQLYQMMEKPVLKIKGVR